MPNKRWEEVASVHLHGRRFLDHTVEISALPELIHFQQLLVRVAAELWRADHPSRERLPKGFEATLALRFSEIRPGSAVFPLEAPAPPQLDLLRRKSYARRAADLIYSAVQSQDRERALPTGFPDAAIPLLSDWGERLGAKESIGLRTPAKQRETKYTAARRRRVSGLLGGTVRQRISLEGETRAADLDGLSFVLRLPDGAKVPGRFKADQESTIKEALKRHSTISLFVQAEAEIWPRKNIIKKITSVEKLEIKEAATSRVADTSKRIWAIVSEIGEKVPRREWRKLPEDLSVNLDDYLYGALKHQ